MAQPQAHLRSLYRSILRELPSRPLNAPPSPLRSRIRASFAEPAEDPSPEYSLRQRQQAEQFIQYVKAQRTYLTLLERYNPGMTMDDEDRIRLSARRVGMNMPIEFQLGKKSGE
jgi:ATP synthase assembly factor FMC1